MVSGSVSLPALGCFSPVPHGTRPLSVTRESLALEGGPPSFTPDSSSRALLRNSTGPVLFAYRAVTVYGAPFQGTSARYLAPSVGPTTPVPQGDWFRLRQFRSPLLSASRLISLPPGTEMFQFPGFASLRREMTASRRPGCPIRPSRDHCVCAAPPSLSQLTTAFLASVCPGIPHMPSLA